MWRTPHGERTLKGAEAWIVAEAVGEVFYPLDMSSDGDDSWISGEPCIDNLSRSQKLVVLADVANALISDEVPAPKLFQLIEAVVNAIYGEIASLIQLEIDEAGEGIQDDPFRLRRKVLEARGPIEPFEDPAIEDFEEEDPLSPECVDMERWHDAIEDLSSRVLWDADWKSGNPIETLVMDAPPEVVEEARGRIFDVPEPEYYSYVPPLPSAVEVEAACRILHRVAGIAD
jgi:hypothetical protein